MLKILGRNNSVNVQKVMWAIGELGLPHQRLDYGGAYGKNKEADYLALNPNGLVPVLEESDGFTMWESNSITRYLARKHDKKNVLEPADPKVRARAEMWMDWQLSVAAPAIHPAFWGLIRTPEDKRDHAAIKASQDKTTANMKMLDDQLAKTQFLAGDSFTYGDIPPGLMCYRFRHLVPHRPAMPNLDRWYAALDKRPAFQEHVVGVGLT